MESDFFVFQRIFVCFIIRLLPYSFSSFLEGSLVLAVASMLKSGNKSEKYEFENDSNRNKNNRLRR